MGGMRPQASAWRNLPG